MNNSTDPLAGYIVDFTNAEKGIIPISTLVPLLIGLVVYKFFHRDWEEGETGSKRMELVNVVASATLLGTLIFHSIKTVAQFDYSLFSCSIIVGLVPYIYLQNMWKTLQLNPEHSVGGRDLSPALDKMTQATGDDYNILEGDPDDMEDLGIVQYEARVAKKFRRIVAFTAFFSILFQSSLDVLFMMYNPKQHPHWQIILMFFIDKVMESTVMFAMLTYARVKRNFYIALVLVYAIVIGLGCIPAIRPLVDPALIIYSVKHPLLSLMVGVGCGSLLWVTTIFLFLDIDENPKKCWGATKATFFLAALFASWATAYWM